MNKTYLYFLALTLFTPIASVHACESEGMLINDSGFIKKVVSGSDKIFAYEKNDGSGKELYQLELLRPYFVICENDQSYKITDIAAETVAEATSGNVGYVLKHQTHMWPTREALTFSKIAFMEDRPEILAWGDETSLEKFMDSGNKKLHPPSFKEDLESTRKRERSTRPYPVLGSKVRKLRKVADKRVYNVLLPAALPPDAKLEISKEDVKKAETVIKQASVVVVFDATASMEKFALETAKSIIGAVNAMPKEIVDNSKMGFVFFRDKNDSENLVPISPIPMREAAKALEKVAGLMSGGGDIPEPFLDAVYYAAKLYQWNGEDGEQSDGRRILIGVLQGDAKPLTTGDLSTNVPTNLDSNSIVSVLLDESLPAIMVQAGPDFGEHLREVMTTVGKSSGGDFIEWEGGSTQKTIAAQLVKKLKTEASGSIKEGKEVLSKMEFDLRGYASIPLEVVNGELLDRLRRNGIDFNLDPGKGGVLVQQGFILENDDLLTPQIQVDKETLQRLVNLYSILGTTGVDADSFLTSAGEAIAAIAGESYDETDPISEIIKKKLGIEFRSELLNFNLEYLTSLVPAERLKFTKRIQDAGNILAQYLEANLEEFDSSPAVWMPVSALP